MQIRKYQDFVNEAKKAGKKEPVEKKEKVPAVKKLPGEKKEKAKKLVDDIVNMLKSKPSVDMTNDWPTEKYAYSLAGIKKYMKGKDYTTTEVDDAMYRIANDKELKDVKEEIEHVMVEVAKYGERYPYYFIEDDKDSYAIVEYYEELQKDVKSKLDAKKEDAKKAVLGRKKEAEAFKIEKKAKAAVKKAEPKKEGEVKKPAKKAAAKKMIRKKLRSR